MTGTEIVGKDPEWAALQMLRVATYGAAGLLRTGLVRKGDASKARLEVPSTRRIYIMQGVPLAFSRKELSVTRRAPMGRLTVCDLNQSSIQSPQFVVLERTGFRSENYGAQLLGGGTPSGRDIYSRALGVDLIRFWLDVERELGEKLNDLLTPDERSRMDNARKRVKRAVLLWMAARRSTLRLERNDLAEIALMPYEWVAELETGERKVTPENLDLVDRAFRERAEEMILLNLGDPSEPFEPPLVVSDNAMRKVMQAAGIPLGGFKAGPSRSNDMPVREAAASGGELPPLPKITSGHDVRRLRNRVGISQRDLGEEAGMGDSVVSNVETGQRKINGDIRLRLAIALENIAARKQRSLT